MFGANSYGSIYYGQTYPQQSVGLAVWVSPLNHATNVSALTPVVFNIPTIASPAHFHLQVDTANTFDTGSLHEYKSYEDTTGWEYWNGSVWTAFSSIGVDPAYIGNQARYTFQTRLATGTWYRRVRGRIIY